MQSPPGPKPPFDIPLDVGVLGRQRLRNTSLLEFYERNKQDFFAAVAILYLDVITDPDPGQLLNQHSGFNSFCDLLTEFFLGAPSETRMLAVDETTGEYVNFFGEGIVAHLGNMGGARQESSIQTMYAPDGSEKHTPEWQLVGTFVKHVAIQYFRAGVSLKDSDIQAAQARIQQLKDRSRSLEYIAEAKKRLYH